MKLEFLRGALLHAGYETIARFNPDVAAGLAREESPRPSALFDGYTLRDAKSGIDIGQIEEKVKRALIMEGSLSSDYKAVLSDVNLQEER